MARDDHDSEHESERQALADRVHHYNAPRNLLFAALTEDRASWLGLQPGEIEPQVLEAAAPERVIWSSFWSASPNDTIEFDLSEVGDQTSIRFRWFTDSPPDERGIGITRQRLNRKFGGNLRAVVSDYYWSTNGPLIRARRRETFARTRVNSATGIGARSFRQDGLHDRATQVV